MQKLSIIITALILSACSTVKPVPECSGAIRKVNPDTALSTISCEREAA